MAEWSDEQEIGEVESGKTLADQDVWVLHRPGPPQGQYSERDYKEPKQDLGYGIKGVTLHVINVNEGEDEQHQKGPEESQHTPQLVGDRPQDRVRE